MAVSDNNLPQTKTEIYLLSKCDSLTDTSLDIHQFRGGWADDPGNEILKKIFVRIAIAGSIYIIVNNEWSQSFPLRHENRNNPRTERPPHHWFLDGEHSFERRNPHQMSKGKNNNDLNTNNNNLKITTDNVKTKEQIRNTPSDKDQIIEIDGYEPLYIRHGQAAHKVEKHGELYGLDYVLDSKGKPKTKKTEQNTQGYMKGITDTVINGVKNKTITWEENGTFQKGTIRGYSAILIYDNESGILNVFKERTREYVTSVRLITQFEREDFFKHKNFGGETNKDEL